MQVSTVIGNCWRGITYGFHGITHSSHTELLMFAWIILAAGLLAPTVFVLTFSKDRSPRNIGRVYLSYLLPISVGFGGLLGFIGHTMRADEIARSIGWPVGNPFQFEVAVTNLAFGVLGLLCIKFRDGFWTATILGYGVFLEGAAYGHVYELLKSGNRSINNAGPILVLDVLYPILLLSLLALANYGRKMGPVAQAKFSNVPTAADDN
jgi:hypothetical protein